MNRRISLLGLTIVVLLALAIGRHWVPADLHSLHASGQAAPADLTQLPGEEWQAVEATVALLKTGGPFPYRQDGSEFSNREGRLPPQETGYYREYTVETAGASDRGARRLVSGRAGEIYYTRDHYQSFFRLN